MEEIAGWVAPIATTVAAMMTASNLGARVTGWGFVVFLLASAAWIVVALGSGQTNLLAANAFLAVVNAVGVWRWLGRQARYGDGARAAEQASARTAAPTLFPASTIADGTIRGADGNPAAQGVDAMVECDSGRIAYMVVREGGAGGVGERLHALDWARVTRCDGGFRSDLSAAEVADLPELAADCWPARPA